MTSWTLVDDDLGGRNVRVEAPPPGVDLPPEPPEPPPGPRPLAVFDRDGRMHVNILWGWGRHVPGTQALIKMIATHLDGESAMHIGECIDTITYFENRGTPYEKYYRFEGPIDEDADGLVVVAHHGAWTTIWTLKYLETHSRSRFYEGVEHDLDYSGLPSCPECHGAIVDASGKYCRSCWAPKSCPDCVTPKVM